MHHVHRLLHGNCAPMDFTHKLFISEVERVTTANMGSAVGWRVFSRSVIIVTLLLFYCYKTVNISLQGKLYRSRQNLHKPGVAALQNEPTTTKTQPTLTGCDLGLTPQRKCYFSSRVQYYLNAEASSQLARLLTSGDICPNPGPISTANA